MGQFSKNVKDLQIYDNYVFCKVMKNKDLCKEMLEILLSMEIENIEYIETESEINDFYNQKGIRMDVYVKNSKSIYNIEMQTGNYSDLLLRARYYQSATDISNTPRRTLYKNLKETYILFICRTDPFNLNLPTYTEYKTFFEAPDYLIDDKTHKIFYNASEYKKVKNKELRAVLKFISILKAETTFTKKLELSVEETKRRPEFEDDYMYFMDIVEEEKEIAREQALAEGLAQGLEQGLEQGLTQGKAEGLAQGKVEGYTNKLVEMINKKLAKKKSINTIADELEESPEYIRELIETKINK